MAKQPKSFTLSPPMIAWLDSRVDDSIRWSSRSAVLEGIIERYRDITKRDLQSLQLTEAERNLICDALNGVWLHDSGSIAFIPAEIDDAVRLNGLGEKWMVDGRKLAERLGKATHGQLVAVVEMVEDFWRRTQAEEAGS